MRAKLSATTAEIPAYFNATGACSLLDPPPKFLPATTKSPLDILFGKSGSIPYIAYFAISYGSLVLLLNLKGIIISVLISSPNTHAFPFRIAPEDSGDVGSVIIIDTSLDRISSLLLQRLLQ